MQPHCLQLTPRYHKSRMRKKTPVRLSVANGVGLPFYYLLIHRLRLSVWGIRPKASVCQGNINFWGGLLLYLGSLEGVVFWCDQQKCVLLWLGVCVG